MQSQTEPLDMSKKQEAESEPAEGEEEQAQLDLEQEELQNRGEIARKKCATELLSERPLHVQYDVCVQNLDLCVEKTRYTGVGQIVLIEAKLSSIEKRLRELLLRMKIWRMEGFPSQYTKFPTDTSTFSRDTNVVLHPLLDSFQNLQSLLLRILKGIDSIWDITKILEKPSLRDSSAINEAERTIINSIHGISTLLDQISDIRNSIQLLHAVHNVSLDADSRSRITRNMQDAALSASGDTSDTTTDYSASSESDYEQCETCMLWLPYQVLPTHTEAVHGEERHKDELPPTIPGSPSNMQRQSPISLTTDFTSVHAAALNGHESVVRSLNEKGANANTDDTDGYTSLYAAAQDELRTANTFLLPPDTTVNTVHFHTIPNFRPAIEQIRNMAMDHAARGKAALAASPANGPAALMEYTRALLEHPYSADYFTERSKAFARLTPARYDLALQDAEYAVLLGRKLGRRAKIQLGQQRRVVALYGLGKYQDAGFLLQKMVEWRLVGQDALPGANKEKTNRNNSDQAEGHIWKAKIEMKTSKMTEEEKATITVTEYPEIDLPSEAEMKKKLQGQLNADGSYNFEGTAESKPATKEAASTAANFAPVTAHPKSTASDKIRYEWYQNTQSVILTIYVMGVPKDKTQIDMKDDSLEISFPHPSDPSSTFSFTVDPFYALVDASSSKCTIMSTKVEFTLAKQVPGEKWKDLEGTEALKSVAASEKPTILASVLASQQAPSYPTSSKSGPKNWNRLANELAAKPKKERRKNTESDEDMEETDESDEGGDPVDGFFLKLYKGADDDTRRAMIKSYNESGGTGLSTNWNEVGSKR